MPAGDGNAQSGTVQFGAIGDTAYSKRGEQEFDRMLDAINKESLAFVVHVGDFEADPRPYARNPDRISMPCTDDSFRRVLASFQRSANPFILTPGDNDWTDCHLLKAHKVDPLERLVKLREMFFPDGSSLGRKTMPVQSQAKDAGFDAEHVERTAANIAWLKKAFAAAKASNAPGLVLMTQANVGFESHWTPSLKARYVRSAGAQPPKETKPTGYDQFVNALADEMEGFGKPTVFIHGDTHLYRINKPLLSKKSKRFFQNFTRIEVFGDPDTHWVRVTVDPANPGLFTAEPAIVRENHPN